MTEEKGTTGAPKYPREVLDKVLDLFGGDPTCVGFAAELELQNKIYNHHKWEGKNGKWNAHVYIDGKRKLITKPTEAELEKSLRRYYDYEHAPYFSDLFQEMLKDKADDIKENSKTRYTNQYNRFCKGSTHAFMKTRVSAMTDDVVEDFILTSIRSFKLNRKAYEGLRTIIRETLRFAKRKGYSKYNVTTFFSELELPKSIFKEKKKTSDEPVYTTEEIEKLREVCRKKKLLQYKVIELMTYTGLRVGEAVAVLPTDIKGDKLIIDKTEITYRKGRKLITEINNDAKLGHSREVPVVEKAKEIVKLAPFDVTTRQVRYALKQASKEAGVQELHPHSIRKWYATILLDSRKFSEAEIQQILGHNDISTTRSYYQRNITEGKKTLKSLQTLMG